jgi:hypothetical protein
MNLNDDVVYRWLRLGPLHQRHPGRSCSLVRHHDRLHRPPPERLESGMPLIAILTQCHSIRPDFVLP